MAHASFDFQGQDAAVSCAVGKVWGFIVRTQGVRVQREIRSQVYPTRGAKKREHQAQKESQKMREGRGGNVEPIM